MYLKESLVCLIFWILTTKAGLVTICNNAVTCESHGKTLNVCQVTEADEIVNATILTQLSGSRCYRFGDRRWTGIDGLYGHYSNILWVNTGCKAVFSLCYLVTNSTLTTAKLTSTTIFTSTLTSTIEFSTSYLPPTLSSIGLLSTIAAITKNIPETTRSSLTDVSKLMKDQRPGSNEGLIWSLIIPLLLILLAVGALGLILCRKRHKRNEEMEINVRSIIDEEPADMTMHYYEVCCSRQSSHTTEFQESTCKEHIISKANARGNDTCFDVDSQEIYCTINEDTVIV